MTDHDRRECAIPGCKYCGGSAEIFRASDASPEHRKMLEAAMRLRPQWLVKARELGMTTSNHEGYMCYNSCETTDHHFAIMSYDVIIADAQGADLEDAPIHDRVHVTAMHGRDSSSPGMARMGTTLDWLYPCGCGRWEMPTDEQTDAMKRKVAHMGARDFARQQRRALTKKRPS